MIKEGRISSMEDVFTEGVLYMTPEDYYALDAAGVQTEIVEGLTHDQEFTKIDRVFPVISAFFKNQGR